jgi:hypothetical protein
MSEAEADTAPVKMYACQIIPDATNRAMPAARPKSPARAIRVSKPWLPRPS